MSKVEFPTCKHQRLHKGLSQGLSSLGLCTFLLAASAVLVLGVAQSNTSLWGSIQQQRIHAQAFETAEAGLAWGLALLNDPRPLDSRCQTAVALPAASLAPTPSPQSLSQMVQQAAKLGQRWTAACRLEARSGQTAVWSCSCGSTGSSTSSVSGVSAGGGLSSVFELDIHAGAGAAMQVRACVPPRTPCDSGHSQGVHQVRLALDANGVWRAIHGSWKDTP